jgi:endonuclease/exonuclease/phosphatase family metal-dependent hydrolase
MKYIFLTLISLLLAGYTYSQNFDDLDFGTDTTLEVVTWNIEWFPKNGQTTVYNVANIIEALDVDIIAFQEIDNKTSFGQMIANLGDWDVYFMYGEYQSLAYIYKTSTVELLDIYEIYTQEDHRREFPRPPLVAEFVFKGVNFIVINNHLKCCGDGEMNLFNAWDEETRRYDACVKLHEYIDSEYPDERVILLGDLNDILTDPAEHNVFKAFYDRPYKYLFADQQIAEGSNNGWSYPGWPSHLDHLLITDELFYIFWDPQTEVKTIKLDEIYTDGMSEYDAKVSDHLPVGIKFPVPENFGVPLDEQNNDLITVYPNPSSDRIRIEVPGRNNISDLKLYDSRGVIVYRSEIQEDMLDVSSFPAGIYFLRMSTEEGIVVKKLILK